MLVVGALCLLLLLHVSSEFHSSSSSNNLKADVDDFDRVFGIHAFVTIVVNEKMTKDLFINGGSELIFRFLQTRSNLLSLYGWMFVLW